MTTAGFELTREYFEGQVAVLTAIVEQIKVKAGSASQRQKDATLTALGGTASFGKDEDVTVFEFVYDVDDEGNKAFNLGVLATFVHNLNEWAAQVANEAVTVILKGQGEDSSLATLKDQYASQKTIVESLQTVFNLVPNVDISDIEIPSMRAGRSPSPATSKKGKHGTFYRIVDGERRPQSSRQDSLSSMAWYYGAAICELETGSSNNGKGVSAPELESFLRKNVIDSPLGKPWQVERMSNDKVTTYGMDVVGGDDTQEEE